MPGDLGETGRPDVGVRGTPIAANIDAKLN